MPIIDLDAYDKYRPAGIIIYRNGTQAIPTGGWNTLQFDTIDFNEHLVYDPASYQVVITEPGWYNITTRIAWNTSAAGALRQLRININGVNIARIRQPPLAGFPQDMFVVKQAHLSPGDTVDVEVRQDTGAPLNLLAGSAFPYLEVVKYRNSFNQKY